MEKQTVIFTALPNGRNPDGALRLSVFVSPRLWNDDATVAKMKLAQFPDLLDWTARIASASWQVTFSGGVTLPATVESAAPRADLWRALFKADTDVKPYLFEDYRGTPIETSPTVAIHDFLEGVYVRAASDPAYGQGRELPTIETLAADPDLSEIARPTQPERPVISTPGREPVDLGGKLPAPEPEPPPRASCGCCGCGCLLWPFALLARIFPSLDRLFRKLFGGGTASGAEVPPAQPVPPFPTPPPPAPENPPVSEPPLSGMPPWPEPLSPNRQAFTDLTKFVTPSGVASPGLPGIEELRERYDFHQMIAALGDYPILLRLLGVVIELRVKLDGAVPPNEGTVQVSPGMALDPTGKIITPRTHYELSATAYGAKPRPSDPEIRHGFLRFDDTSKFRVIQVDAVGGGVKAQNAATNFLAYSTKVRRAPNMPDEGGLPALRTSGISVVRRNLVPELNTAFVRSHALQLAVKAVDMSPLPPPNAGAGAALAATDELFAEDLVRGYRIDVFDDKSNAWHSLCQRRGHYEFLDAPDAPGGKVSLDFEDEGFIQFAATEQNAPGTKPLRATDSLFAWDGWSLCAPRPGKFIMPPEAGDPPEKVKVDRPKSSAVTNFKLETAFRAVPASLPRLRFDYKYRLRARVCDLAGNSVTIPGAPEFANDVPEQTPEFRCARYEPIAPPSMMLREAPLEGESVERLVVRSPSVTATDQASDRHIVPPKVSQLMAEQHSKFDGVPKMLSDPAGYNLAGREAGALNDGATEAQPSIWVQPAAQFTLTYLPDPASRGALLLNVPGLAPNEIIEPGAKIVNKVPFGDAWPDRRPFRIRLVGIARGTAPAEPLWNAAERVLTLELPQAEKRLVKLSSWFTADDLERQGVWQWIKAKAPPQLAQLQNDAVAGRSWTHLPWRDLTLIHAVLKPLDPPAVAVASPAEKKLGETTAVIKGDVTCDAASTGKVDLLAAWIDPLDDLAQPAPTTREQRTHLCEVFIEEGAAVTQILDSVKGKKPVHHFGDTKFHSVTYTPVATTRFREYFPESLTSNPANVTLPGTPSTPVVILNSARPDAPKVLYIVPTYGWSEETPAPDAVKRTRKGGGLRIYLDRPWYSSGAGELLGVVFKEEARFTDLSEEERKVVTHWGADPIWVSFPTDVAARKKHFKGAVEKLDVTPAELNQIVAVMGYAVQFDPMRRLWFSDIDLEIGPAYTPFVRLALVRLQPNSVEGAHISRVVPAQFVQLAPDRVASVTTTTGPAGAKFKVLIQGPTYVGSSAMRAAPAIHQESGFTGRAEVEVLLQKRDPALGTDPDLAWRTLSTTLLQQQPTAPHRWEGEVELTETLTPSTFRLLLREYEWYRSDYQKEEMIQGASVARRLVYADVIAAG